MNGWEAVKGFGGIDDRYIAEALTTEASESGQGRRIIMNGKKRLGIILVAAVLILALSVTAIAVGVGNLTKMSKYVEDQNGYGNVPDALRNADVEGMGNDLMSEDSPDLAAGEARVTSILAGKRGFIMTFEINLNDSKEFTDVIDPSIGWYEFKNFGIYEVTPEGEKISRNSICDGPSLVTNENGVYTFAFKGSVYDGMPDELGASCDSIIFHDLNSGNYVDIEYDHGFEISVVRDSYDLIETINSKETNEINGVEFTAELDGLGMYLYAPEATAEEHDTILDVYYSAVTFKLTDGTEITDMLYPDFSIIDADEYFNGTRLLSGGGTSLNGVYCEFMTVYDVSLIESVTVCGVEFTF